MELELFDRNRIDTIFSRALPQLPNVDMWTEYLNYLRRILPLVPDPTGTNRSTITQAFDAVLDAVGIDPDSGKLWREYVDFVRDGPGVVGGEGWQDRQKADLLRAAYQRAVKLPHGELVKLWKEYDNFELSLNKVNGRQKLQEMSPHYMTAKTSRTQMDHRIVGLDRSSLPVLPPVAGCEGEEAFASQLQRWKDWLAWESDDPMVYNGEKDRDVAAYRKRILYVYRQAVMFLHYYPPMWFDAANWCFEQGSEEMTAQGEDFLDRGMKANPESVLLALEKADRVESGLETGSSDEVAIANGEKLDVVFERVHKALYDLREKMLEREKEAVQKIKEHFASLPPKEEDEQGMRPDEDDDDEDSPTEKPKTRAEEMQAHIQQLQAASKAHLEVLKHTISYVWVAKMRAFRRVQGQGMPNKPKKGFRGVLAEARPRGQLSSEVYIASALMEWNCYKDPSALKLFEKGLRLFPTDEGFAMEYIKHLVACSDLTNARVVFETTVGKIMGTQTLPDQQRKQKARPLMAYMHSFESNYGELAQIKKLDERMKEMYPGESDFDRFSQRFVMAPGFDGTGVQLILSTSQARPKTQASIEAMQHFVPTIEQPRATPEVSGLRLGPSGPYIASPKRPLDLDSDGDTPRKFMRAESPLKGAAGRRIQSTNITHSATNSTSGLNNVQAGGGSGFVTKNYIPGSTQSITAPVPVGPPPLPELVRHMLAQLPPASQYRAVVFDPAKTVEVIRQLDMGQARMNLGR